MEGLYHISPYFGGIFPYIGLVSSTVDGQRWWQERQQRVDPSQQRLLARAQQRPPGLPGGGRRDVREKGRSQERPGPHQSCWNPGKTGVEQLTEALNDELLAAATLLDTTQRQSGDSAEVQEAVQKVLTHFRDDAQVGPLQRWKCSPPHCTATACTPCRRATGFVRT